MENTSDKKIENKCSTQEINDLNIVSEEVTSQTVTDEDNPIIYKENNSVLTVSEKDRKVFLPYTHHEISLYLEQYPNVYSSPNDVIEKEFVLSLDYYMNHPTVARFREAYALIRDRESKTIVDALKFAFEYMFRYDINPAIISGCKTQEQFEHYLECLEKNDLDSFTDFTIKFELNPLA